MAEQGPSGQTEVQEGNTQAVEIRTCALGRVQGCHLDVQESQDTDGTEFGKGCKE